MMIVHFRVWLRDRETHKRSCFCHTSFVNEDLLEAAHNLLLSESDKDFECYRIDLIDISCFQV